MKNSKYARCRSCGKKVRKTDANTINNITICESCIKIGYQSVEGIDRLIKILEERGMII